MSAQTSYLTRMAILAGSIVSGIAGPSPASAQEAHPGGTDCVLGPNGARLGGIAGVVRVESTPFVLSGADIAIAQLVSTGEPAPGIPTEAVADSEGRYRICHVPPGVTLLLEARKGGSSSRRARAWIPRDSVVRRDLVVPLGQAGRARGRVRDRDSGDPVAGALVSVPELGAETLTSDQGGFALPALPPGTYPLHVEHLAFGTRVDSVTLLPGRSVVLEVQVESRAIPVEPLLVEVTAVESLWLEATGFYRRMHRELGAFITREEIEQRRPVLLSDLFQTVPGMRVDRGRVQMTRAPGMLMSGGGCDIQYFIDGRSVELATGLDSFMPDDIEAVEVYRGPSETPPEFNMGDAACGAIVLWMRVSYGGRDP